MELKQSKKEALTKNALNCLLYLYETYIKMYNWNKVNLWKLRIVLKREWKRQLYV